MIYGRNRIPLHNRKGEDRSLPTYGCARLCSTRQYRPEFVVVQATFDVTRVWKGSVASEVSIFTPVAEGICGFRFSEGEDYILYADRGLLVGGAELVATICNRTGLSTDQEIRALGGFRDFARGDVDGEGGIDLADAIQILNHLFLSGQVSCLKSADVNDSGALELLDAVNLINFLFQRGNPPPAPFGGCGQDPTPDDLSCSERSACS